MSAGYHQCVRAHLASLLDDFERHHRETAVVAHRGNRRYATTYDELRQLAGRFSAELDRRGIAPGERVVLWGENSAEWIACFFGCLLRGVIAVPLDAAGTPEFAGRVIHDVAPKLVVADARLLASLRNDVHDAIRFGELRSALPQQPLFAVSDAVTEETPFQIVFTSGTTSEPRGIVHTHRNVLVTLAPIEREMQKYLRYEWWVHPLRFLHSLPLSHVFGQFMGLWIPAMLGAEVHFGEALEASRVVELIRRERISVLIAVPRVQQLLRAHLLGRFPRLAEEIAAAEGMKVAPRWWRFRKVHRALGWKFWAVISGGATLPAELETFWNRLGFALIQGYGMTETSALVTLNHPFQIKKGTIGKPLPGREVKLTEEGEILVRGPMLAGKTWQGGTMREREGEWLATGDLAEQSATGELKFLGRKGDVIVTAAGMNIHPADLEATLMRQPGMRACAVVACESGAGPEPVAVAIFSGSEQEMQDAVSVANVGLAEFQKMRRVLRWPELQFPYTSTGKLLRRQIAAWACSALSGRQGAANATGDELLRMIAEVTGETPPADSSDALRLSEDLRLDSLGRVQLQSLIEQRLGIELNDDSVANVATLGNLRALVQAEVGGSNTDSVTEQNAVADTAPTARITRTADADDADEHRYWRWPWSWPAQMLRVAFMECAMRPLVWLLAAPQIVRTSDTYPDGPFLIIANHVTAYDGALILYGLPPRLRRRVAAAMSAEMLADLRRGRNQGNWFLNLLAPAGYWLITTLFNVFPLPRARGFRRSFAHAGEAMDRGFSVLIFPEGTRTRDERMHGFRPGIGLLAEQARVPVLPVGLAGLAALHVADKGWFRSGKLAVRVGGVIPVDATAEPAELTARFEQAVRKLAEQ